MAIASGEGAAKTNWGNKKIAEKDIMATNIFLLIKLGIIIISHN